MKKRLLGALLIALFGIMSVKAANVLETVYVPFTLGLTGVDTENTFSDWVNIEVSGTGQCFHNQWSDAFYIYTPGPNEPNVPVHYRGDWNMGLKINGKEPEAFEGFVLPEYNPTHRYTITIKLDRPGPINFSVGDPNPQDNTGQFVVTVEQVEEPSDLARAVVGKDYALIKGDSTTKGWEDGRFQDVEDAEHFDCSGLVYWAHNKAHGATEFSDKSNPVYYENAHGQYAHNTAPVDEEHLLPGDVIFFDWNGDGEMQHVAMYVGSDQIVSAQSHDASIEPGKVVLFDYDYIMQHYRPHVPEDGFRRFVEPTVESEFENNSPVHLAVTDSQGNTITHESWTITGSEAFREVGGVLYYTEWDEEDGHARAKVYSPSAMPGTWQIKALPKDDAALTDTYSITAKLAGEELTLAADVQVADIPPDGYFLDIPSVTVTKQGDGVVTSAPGPIDCGSVCTTGFLTDTPVTFTATADPGWTFADWTGDVDSTENPLALTVHGDTAMTATFIQEQYTLHVSIVGQGDVDVDPDQETYIYGDVITLTGTADPGWTFIGWSGSMTTSTNPLALTLHESTTVAATFQQVRPVGGATLPHPISGSLALTATLVALLSLVLAGVAVARFAVHWAGCWF